MCIRDRHTHLHKLEEYGFLQRDPAKPRAIESVSYTHLDVYKRQALANLLGMVLCALQTFLLQEKQ